VPTSTQSNELLTFLWTKKRSPPAQFWPQFKYAALSATCTLCKWGMGQWHNQ